MRSLLNDAFRISRSRSIKQLATVGQCHYHSNNIPIIKTTDDEIAVKVNVGIGKQVNLR